MERCVQVNPLLANHIMRTFPGYQKYSFAKRVKELCVELFDMKGKDRELLITFANSMQILILMCGLDKF